MVRVCRMRLFLGSKGLVTKLIRALAACALACTAISNPAIANNWVATPISRLLAHDDGSGAAGELIVVYMASSMQSTPGCHTGPANKFYVDLSRAPSKAQYAMLLTAVATERSVTVLLNNQCIDGVALLRNVELAD